MRFLSCLLTWFLNPSTLVFKSQYFGVFYGFLNPKTSESVLSDRSALTLTSNPDKTGLRLW
ncbi:hypothetical protein [Candidatus Williamhamiltonella defendens]|uniref:hypothetical protein n=1 Tax=Candidatus Williamhamiltonella defendens TaxID=138072 RepID=UPI0016516785|nr:hypothetical protein [Candidatus Hamiltonella defensa]